jgi:hypothetical protein
VNLFAPVLLDGLIHAGTPSDLDQALRSSRASKQLLSRIDFLILFVLVKFNATIKLDWFHKNGWKQG